MGRCHWFSVANREYIFDKSWLTTLWLLCHGHNCEPLLTCFPPSSLACKSRNFLGFATCTYTPNGKPNETLGSFETKCHLQPLFAAKHNASSIFWCDQKLLPLLLVSRRSQLGRFGHKNMLSCASIQLCGFLSNHQWHWPYPGPLKPKLEWDAWFQQLFLSAMVLGSRVSQHWWTVTGSNWWTFPGFACFCILPGWRPMCLSCCWWPWLCCKPLGSTMNAAHCHTTWSLPLNLRYVKHQCKLCRPWIHQGSVWVMCG